MSGGTTRHRRLGSHLVEVQRPNAWDDDDEATEFYERARGPAAHPHRDVQDDELTIMLPRLVEPRRPAPRAVVPRPSSFVAQPAPRARERPIARPAVQRRDPRPRLVELPPTEITEVEPPRRQAREVEARALPPRPPPRPARTVAAPVLYEPPQPQFARPPLHVPADYIAREFGRPRRRPAGVSLGFCVLVGGLAFLAARAWHAPPPAGVAVVATTPSDAQVFVDGQELTGQTSPFKLTDLEVGREHLIEVSKPGFISQTRRLRIEAGDVRVLPGIDLEAAPAQAQVLDLPVAHLRAMRTVTDRGKGARPSGKATHSTTRHSGSGSGSSARAGVREQREQREPREDDASSPPTPAGPDGTLRINSLPWAEVFIDERSIGTTPQLAVALAPGRHKVRLVNPELNMVKGFSIEIRPGATLTKLVQMVE